MPDLDNNYPLKIRWVEPDHLVEVDADGNELPEKYARIATISRLSFQIETLEINNSIFYEKYTDSPEVRDREALTGTAEVKREPHTKFGLISLPVKLSIFGSKEHTNTVKILIAESDFTDKREVAVFGASKDFEDYEASIFLPEEFLLEIHLSKEKYRSLRKNIVENKVLKLLANIDLCGAKKLFSPRWDYGDNDLSTIKYLDLSSDVENFSALDEDIKERFADPVGSDQHRATDFEVYLTSEIEGLQKIKETEEEDEFTELDWLKQNAAANKASIENLQIKNIMDGLDSVFWCLVVLIGLLGFIAYRLF